MSEESERDYRTVSELAKRWDVTDRTIRNWIADGVFPNAYKVGLGKSHYRVPINDVVAFEKARRINPS